MQSYSFPHHLSNSDILRNHQLVENARSVISSQLELDLEEDGSLTGFYAGFFLAVSFSDLHPLMVVTLFYLPCGHQHLQGSEPHQSEQYSWQPHHQQ